jgi:hypothetical protein
MSGHNFQKDGNEFLRDVEKRATKEEKNRVPAATLIKN